MLSTSLGRFRLVSLCEGMSYVVLLAIAMPLKYAAGQPRAVTIVGGIHGALFVLFCIALLAAAREQRWKIRTMVVAMIAAILPLGAFWLERALRRGEFPSRSPSRE
jgi:integral membrane protein